MDQSPSSLLLYLSKVLTTHAFCTTRLSQGNRNAALTDTFCLSYLHFSFRELDDPDTASFLQVNFDKPTFEPRHDKTNKMSVRPAKSQINQGLRPV